jgi:pyruvyl transferase EpsO
VEWLGRNGVEVVFTCDQETYSRERMAARLGGGVILLHGGGNLGDFWVAHQQFRELVIQDFPGNAIIQLPQTIFFMDAWGLGEARRIFDAHHHLTLLCRDRQSLDFARTHFAAPSLLCPDMAFALGPLSRPCPPEQDVVWLARTDAESTGAARGMEGVRAEPIDWLEEPPSPARDRCAQLTGALAGHPADWEALLATLAETYDALARERLARGCRILSRGKVVITDRLHAHILCLLMGIPHAVLDNNYGKVKNFYHTWTAESGLARWADGSAEALAFAQALARREGSTAH